LAGAAGPVDDVAPPLVTTGGSCDLLPAVLVARFFLVHGFEPVRRSPRRGGSLLAAVLGLFFRGAPRNICAMHASKDGVIQAEPVFTVLSAYVDGIMATAGILAMVVHHADELVLGHPPVGNRLSLLAGERLAGNLQLQGVINVLPN